MGNPFVHSSEKSDSPSVQYTPQIYAPPPGSPPGQQTYHAPSGASTSAAKASLATQGHAPPPGPPPGHQSYAPPPGPPPNYQGNLPANHDWRSVPDAALLPPPPSIGHDYGSKSNAELDDANRAHEWCKSHPLIRPNQPTSSQVEAIRNGDVRVMKPVEYKGDLIMLGTGTWSGSTRVGAKDSCLISSAPLYFALTDAPSHAGQKKTIYFEVGIKSLGRGRRNEECAIAIGYCAIPYPTWRMPGWERGSLAIHSDDGRRYVNDTWGGKDFSSPMETGDTVGLGITYTLPTDPPAYDNALKKLKTTLAAEVFFTRNGHNEGGWDLHEELDAKLDQETDGLDGTYDLFAAVGVYGGAEFEIKFKRENWLWLPR